VSSLVSLKLCAVYQILCIRQVVPPHSLIIIIIIRKNLVQLVSSFIYLIPKGISIP
jgi:hypothetical protein